MNNDTEMEEGDSEISVRDEMLDRVAKSDGHFKHQQQGEAEITYAEKKEICTSLLDSKPITFLTQYGSYLNETDLSYFQNTDNETVLFQVENLKKALVNTSKETKSCVKKNRRYAAMQKLESENEHFSDVEMKHREPLLYEQLIGQYLTEEEAATKIDRSDLRLSTIIGNHMDIVQDNTLRDVQQEYEESQLSEEDEDTDDEEKEEFNSEKSQITDTEKLLLRQEFLSIMKQRFLDGKDSDVDYSEIDNNTEYDCLDLIHQDAQEQYFDND